MGWVDLCDTSCLKLNVTRTKEMVVTFPNTILGAC